MSSGIRRPPNICDEYSDANIAFHTAVIALGGSQMIIDATRNLLLHVRAIRRATITQSDRAARSIIDHLKIIEALEKRDTEQAERLTRQHTLDLAAHVDRHCGFLRGVEVPTARAWAAGLAHPWHSDTPSAALRAGCRRAHPAPQHEWRPACRAFQWRFQRPPFPSAPADLVRYVDRHGRSPARQN